MQNKIITVENHYSDAGHEEYLNSKKNEITIYADVHGKQDGEKNLPVKVDEYYVCIWNKVSADIQSLIDDNQRRHLPFSGASVAKRINDEAESEIQKKDALIRENDYKLSIAQEKKKRFLPNIGLRLSRAFVITFLIVFALSDGYLSYPAWRNANMPEIPALIASVCVATAVGAGAHWLAEYIAKAVSKKQRLFRYASILGLYLIGFGIIGYYRARAYNYAPPSFAGTGNITHIPVSADVSGWYIALFSFIIFWLGLFFSIRVCKTDSERKRDEEYRKACDEVNSLLAQKESFLSKINEIRDRRDKEIAGAITRYEYALANECTLRTFALQVLNVYHSANRNFRPDNLIPPFFSNPPQFRFNTFFDNIKPR